MRVTRRIWAQLAALTAVALTALTIMMFNFVQLPAMLFGYGRYTVTVDLPDAAGLYERANVQYHGTKVGEVDKVRLSGQGVQAVLSLDSDISIPSNLEAEVHSTSAAGEQYVALNPRDASSRPLKDGDVITLANTRVPPNITELLDAANRGLDAIPADNLQTAVNEGSIALAGLGPDLRRLIKGSTALAADSKKTLPELINLVDNLPGLLDTQSDTAGAVRGWAEHLASITQGLQRHDADVSGVLGNGRGLTDELQALYDRLKPTLPVLLANLVSVEPVLLTYQPNVEQLLVLVPQGIASLQGIGVPNRNTKQAYNGAFLSFNLNLNYPPPCTTGFLPAQQRRDPAVEDYPPTPDGDLYCRVPQDSPFAVRGARNIPCETRPGKRAPTVAMCESDQVYVPLNDGLNWKGDPNATLTGQGIPQISPELPTVGASSPAAPPVTVATYDPATGNYIGNDGRVHTAPTLNQGAAGPQTWQDMLTPNSR